MFLPLFPLEVVVFPREELSLHIFEPRYKQLIGECIETNAPFGVPCLFKGRLAEYGTALYIARVFHVFENGEMDILTRGAEVFHLEKLIDQVPDKLYTAGDVSWLHNESDAETYTQSELLRQYERLQSIEGLQPPTPLNDVDGDLSFAIGQGVGMNLGQKLYLLSLSKESERQKLLLEHLNAYIPKAEKAKELLRRVKSNGRSKPFLKFRA